jgi:hypothetical protein
MRRKHRTLALVRRRRLRAPHIPSPDVRGVGCAGSGQPRTVSPDVRCGPCGLRSLGCACAGGSASAWASACAGQLRRLPGYGELEASSNESPRRKPRGCPGGETLRVFPSAHASGFQTGRRGVTPAVETAYVGHFTGNMASCHFPLADLRRPVFIQASGPNAEGVGAGLCPATVSRRRRRDGGDGATASPQ